MSPVRHIEAPIREGLEAQRNIGIERDAGGAWLGTYSPGKRALGGNEEHTSLLRSWWRAVSVEASQLQCISHWMMIVWYQPPNALQGEPGWAHTAQ